MGVLTSDIIDILDEIDAALDLSHTQNIGVMLRTHFSNSQFIVVSLKEGMFANANCLFRTKFVDGVSTVMRTVNRSLPALPMATTTTTALSDKGNLVAQASQGAGQGKVSRKRAANKNAEEHEEEVEN
jgi:structural maintenance of chromosome 2